MIPFRRFEKQANMAIPLIFDGGQNFQQAILEVIGGRRKIQIFELKLLFHMPHRAIICTVVKGATVGNRLQILLQKRGHHGLGEVWSSRYYLKRIIMGERVEKRIEAQNELP